MDESTAGSAQPLARKYFTCPDVYRQETERIFRQHWTYVGHQSQFPQSTGVATRTLAGEPILLVREQSGTIRAFHNACRHRGTTLLDACNDETAAACQSKLMCPYHGWTYDLQGRLKAAPNMHDVAEFDIAQFPLFPVRLEEWHGFLFATHSPTTNALADWLGEFEQQFSPWDLDNLEVVESISYEVQANWKLLFENYSECYHCPLVHPQLQRLSSFRSASNVWEEGPILGGPMILADDCESMSADGRLSGKVFPRLSTDQRREVHYVTVFPSLFFSPHPDYVMTHRIERLAIDRTRITCDFLFNRTARDEPTFNPSAAIEFWDQTNRQDWEVCERTQQGLRTTRFKPGPYSPFEPMVRAFDQHYLESMTAGKPN